LISRTIDELTKLVHQSSGPLAEVELWRCRYISASSLGEELDCEEIPKIIEVLEKINSQTVPNYCTQKEDLIKYLKQ
jgi:hypothetical protein